jgi:hypothetical protein
MVTAKRIAPVHWYRGLFFWWYIGLDVKLTAIYRGINAWTCILHDQCVSYDVLLYRD